MRTRSEWVRNWVSRWWAGEAGMMGAFLEAALWPAELGFRGATRLRNHAYDRSWLPSRRASIPVISVGNLGVGGAGKTPLAAWLASRLSREGHRPAIVLRGYGEDEILVHRELNPEVPVFAAAKRLMGVEAAAAAGRTIAVLDDAFQHRALVRDLDLVLIPIETWTPSRRLLPRGPWREDERALRRADAILLTRKAASDRRQREVRDEISKWADGKPIVECHIRPAGIAPLHGGAAHRDSWDPIRNRRVLAVAAIADPGAFSAQLRMIGADVELLRFPDHHPYSAAEASEIIERAAGRPVVTTHKDAVKLRKLFGAGCEVFVMHQQVEFDSGQAELEAALVAVAGKR